MIVSKVHIYAYKSILKMTLTLDPKITVSLGLMNPVKPMYLEQ